MKYSRVLIKLSGEMLGSRGVGFDSAAAAVTAGEIKEASDKGLQAAVLVGGGNIMRARDSAGLDRLTADFMGMTATLINSLGLKGVLRAQGADAVVMSALKVPGAAEELSADRAVDYLESGKIVIFAGGTGAPFFTTDTAAALRALEIGADVLLKATKVDGVYDSDPEKNSSAELLEGEITFEEAYKKGVKVMDRAALSLLEEHRLPVVVFNFTVRGNLARVLAGEPVGTRIC